MYNINKNIEKDRITIGRYTESKIENIVVKLPEDLEIKEFVKGISFISEDIISYRINNHELILKCEILNEEHRRKLIEKAELNISQFISTKKYLDIKYDSAEEENNEDDNSLEYLERRIPCNEIMSGSNIIQYEDGVIGFAGGAAKLFNYFDSVFKGFADKIGAEEEKYPVLLPLKTLDDTGYLKTSPQYQMFCEKMPEDMEELQKIYMNDSQIQEKKENLGKVICALSPSACFHVYERYRNINLNEPKSVTLLQNVFRNEGRFGWKEFGRLKDYHVREVVFIGDVTYVEQARKKIMEMTKCFMKKIKLSGRIVRSSDCFMIPQMQKYKLIQLKRKSKYEVCLEYRKENRMEEMAAGSFNFHGNTFTYPFHIKVEGKKQETDDTVTGCVGFGIERWVLCFLSRYGECEKNWPEEVRKEIYEEVL